jgi:hypothetical protein
MGSDMRYPHIIVGTVLVVGASIAGVLLSARMMGADAAKETRATLPPPSIGIMTMMGGAKDLPVQQYDPI